MSAERATAGAGVRAEAARVVARVVADGASLDAALAGQRLGERERALARALASGAVRWHYRLDWLVRELLDRPLPKREAVLAALLRIGLFQLEFMRVPEHAAVSATVEASRLIGRAGHAKLVNAVLRRFQRERAALTERIKQNPEAHYAHPRWLLERFERDWPAQWPAIVAANNEQPPMWLRVNLRRGSRADYLERLAAAGIAAEPSGAVASAVELAAPLSVGELPGFAEGAVSVQDAAAQHAALLLDVGPGQRVLDACAAPGGKTAHLLERCPALAELWALDHDPKRLALVEDNLERLGLSAQLRVADAGRPEEWWDGTPFERILLDAPCSATGVIRRHPDIKVLRRPEDIARSRSTEARLLAALWPLLAPGGRLLYATCSVLREENAELIGEFLAATPEARLEGGPDRTLQILPGEANMDGFYYACLAKRDMTRVSHLEDH